MKSKALRIGSRGSDLALWQARWVASELRRISPSREISLEVIRTKGDRILDSPLAEIGGKGLFTREIEEALLDGRIDLAVHSLKDLPTELPAGLTIAAICAREDVRDVFIPHPGNPLRALRAQAHGAKIATGSLRRKCQILSLRADIQIVDVRGNLTTRMKKLGESDWAGMVLARAGVLRLEWEQSVGETLPVEVMLPAVGQGALAVEVRQGDGETASAVAPLSHGPTTLATTAERALLRRLEGGCHVPIGAYARTETGGGGIHHRLVLDAMVGGLDGRTMIRAGIHGSPDEADRLGRTLAETLLAAGADRILGDIRGLPHEPA